MAVPVGGMVAAVSIPALNALGGTSLVFATGAVMVGLVGLAFSAVSDGIRIQHDDSVGIVRGVWHGRGLKRLFVVTIAYLFVLQTVLIYTVPAMHAAGFTTFQAGFTYFVVNVTAIVSRVAWGRIADRDEGTRRKRSLVESGVMSSIGALTFGLALHGGLGLVLPAIVFYAFAALGWNAIVYALAGEWTTPELAARSFSIAATVVFVGSALVSPMIGGLADSVGWDALWVIAAAIGLVGATAARALPDRGVEAARP
jgi:MFS family permease